MAQPWVARPPGGRIARGDGLSLAADIEARTREVTEQGGFTRFRRAAETPFNAVYEVRG